MKYFSVDKALKAINKRGVVLVFPVNNAKDPHSIWHEFFPRSKMVWEWSDEDDSGDDRVWELWHFRTKLSQSKRLYYGKFFQNRACYVSKKLLPYMLAAMNDFKRPQRYLNEDAIRILDFLEESSPVSTKLVKKECEMRGKFLKRNYAKAIKLLWQRGLICGRGEVDDGAFPSLAIGATSLLHEHEFEKAVEIDRQDAIQYCEKNILDNSIRNYVLRLAAK